MSFKIALAGNPNSGKTTLFNALTGSNQFVGNWPGVTVEKKEGRYKGDKEVIITDLPGIYSLSPYTLEEVVARNYIIDEKPDGILNIIDGTNLERNLYLTTQLVELGIPMVVAVNMLDVLEKNGDKLNIENMSKALGCPVVEISALNGTGVKEAAEKVIEIAKAKKVTIPQHKFTGSVEHAIAHIEEAALHDMPQESQRWYAVKIFERDEKLCEKLGISKEVLDHIERDIKRCEDELDDDAESIITNERYTYIASIIGSCYIKKSAGKLSATDRIDSIVTNKWLGLPIFAVVMWAIYYISMVTVGSAATDWANDGLFGDGYHLFGIGTSAYEDDADAYTDASQALQAFIDLGGEGADELSDALDTESESFDPAEAKSLATAYLEQYKDYKDGATTEVEDEETLEISESDPYYIADAKAAVETLDGFEFAEPDPADYGVWVPGIPVLIGNALEAIGCSEWLEGLILDGIVAGVGAVLGFVPQMLVLFFLLAFVESCGYMARIAFVLDRVFRRFGLSGKSFIPILIGTGCGIPGVMASRTIESEKDRRMTVMTTTFIPCGAKQPFIAMIAGAIFGGSPYIATGAYFMGMAAIIISGIILKKTKMFAGDPTPFVMELPAYRMPTLDSLLRSMWERGWSFIKKAGTIILLSTIFVWFTTYFGFTPDGFRMLSEDEIGMSLLASIGSVVAVIFKPLGWGNWQAAVASITGLVAKENIVGTLGILYGGGELSVYAELARSFTKLSGMSFLIFNLLCAPCFAAMGAIKREMNSTKWTTFAIGYECVFAYAIALIVYQLGSLFTGRGFTVGTVAGIAVLAVLIYALVRPEKKYSE